MEHKRRRPRNDEGEAELLTGFGEVVLQAKVNATKCKHHSV